MLLVATLPLLGACANGTSSPWADTLDGLLTGAERSVAERAEALSFASLSLDTGDRRGLVVLGTLTGETSYWPTGGNGLISLYQEGLYATAGLPQDLLDTRYSSLGAPEPQDLDQQDSVPWRESIPRAYRLTRLWQTANGLVAGGEARGHLTCGAVESRELPLTTLPLQRCDQRLKWHDGSITHGTLWRDPETYRLWAVSEQPWPGAASFKWEVARPWW